MIILAQNTRKLMVELAFCALSHRLTQQAEQIFAVFPVLIPDPQTCQSAEVIMLIGLGRLAEARLLIEHCSEQQANILSTLLPEHQ